MSAGRLLPGWLAHYERDFLGADLAAGLTVWSIVVPQALAYAQIAGLRPELGLVAAPGALIGYALFGTSRSLIVGATSSTAALSAATVGPLANGDAAAFAALSAALALVVAAVFMGAGLLRLGGVSDLISKPILTGFLFGLGLTIAVGQLPKLLGIEGGSGEFFEKLWAVVRDLGDTHGLTLAVGLASVAILVALRRVRPTWPSSLILLVLAIGVSAAADLSGRGVDVVGDVPEALPDLSIPDVSASQLAELLGGAFGIALVGYAEAIGVARATAAEQGYRVNANRELIGLGGGNVLAGLSGGFVQSGGASQTAAAARAGGRTQLVSIVAAVLVLLTGGFLAGVFEDLPQATLGAIVLVAVTSFFRVGELERFFRIRRSALLLALVALGGVLVLGILPGLIVASALAIVVVIQKLSRPQVGVLARDPATGAFGRLDRHPDWLTSPEILAIRIDGPLFYANAATVQERVLTLARLQPEKVVLLDLEATAELDVESADMLAELADALAGEGSELRLVAVRAPVLDLLGRSGLLERVRVEATLEGTR